MANDCNEKFIISNKRNKTKLFSSKMLASYICYYTSYIKINTVKKLKFLAYVPKIIAKHCIFRHYLHFSQIKINEKQK